MSRTRKNVRPQSFKATVLHQKREAGQWGEVAVEYSVTEPAAADRAKDLTEACAEVGFTSVDDIPVGADGIKKVYLSRDGTGPNGLWTDMQDETYMEYLRTVFQEVGIPFIVAPFDLDGKDGCDGTK